MRLIVGIQNIVEGFSPRGIYVAALPVVIEVAVRHNVCQCVVVASLRDHGYRSGRASLGAISMNQGSNVFC